MVQTELQPKAELQPPIPIIRVIPVAPISLEDFQLRVQTARREKKPIDSIPLCEVIMLQKSDASKPSAGLVMPIGGEMGIDESIFYAGIRELTEETTLQRLSTNWAKPRQNNDYFTYQIGHGYANPRKMHVFTLPVRSSSFSAHLSREGTNGNQDKIQRLISIPSNELEATLQSGSLQVDGNELKLAGNFTFTQPTDISISTEDANFRNSMLHTIISQVKDFETEFKEAMLYQINSDRQKKGRRDAKRLSDCATDELTKGFVLTQLNLDLHGNHDSKTGKPHLLTTANYLSAVPARYISDLVDTTALTGEAEQLIERFTPAFITGAKTILEAMNIKTEDTESTRETLKKLKTVWPSVVKLGAPQTVRLLQEANNTMISELAKGLQVTQGFLTQALHEALTFHTFITNELRHHPSFTGGIFQEYRPRSELVSDPLLFTMSALALGFDPDRLNLHPKETPDVANRRLPFEAIRALSLFGIAIDVVQEINKASNQNLQRAINRLFKEELTSQIIDLGNGRLHSIPYRVTKGEINGASILIEYDDREKKTPHSAIRKAFTDPDLEDIFSINFVIADSNFTSQHTLQDRIVAGRQFRDMLFSNIQEEMSNDPNAQWIITMVDRTHKKGVLDDLASQLNTDENTIPQASATGKRPGSEGNRILREKFILELKGSDGTTEKIEICIYPFESSEFPHTALLGEKGFWGFTQKIRDDYEGNYHANRLIMRDPNQPEEESLYELYQPLHIYHAIAQKMMTYHVNTRKDTAA